jgi:hypothetical protein
VNKLQVGDTASLAADPRIIDALLTSVATEKGTVNQRAVLNRQVTLCDVLQRTPALSSQQPGNS